MSEPKACFLLEAGASLPDIPIRNLDLPTRAKNALLSGGIQSLSDMADWRESDLLTLPHCGPATVDALKAIIMRLNRTTRQRGLRRWTARSGLGHQEASNAR